MRTHARPIPPLPLARFSMHLGDPPSPLLRAHYMDGPLSHSKVLHFLWHCTKSSAWSFYLCAKITHRLNYTDRLVYTCFTRWCIYMSNKTFLFDVKAGKKIYQLWGNRHRKSFWELWVLASIVYRAEVVCNRQIGFYLSALEINWKGKRQSYFLFVFYSAKWQGTHWK